MTQQPEQPGPEAERMELIPSEREPSDYDKWLETATRKLGSRFEEIIASDPADCDTAEELLNEIEMRLQLARAIRERPQPSDRSNPDLLEDNMDSRGAAARAAEIRRMHGTEISESQRRRSYDRQESIVRNTALSGPDKKTLASATVTLNWLEHGDNEERLRTKEAELDELRWNLPPRRRSA